MKKQTIFEIYDKLHPNINKKELKEICKDLIFNKPIFEYFDGESYNFNKTHAKKVVVLFGEKEFKKHYNQEVPEKFNDILAVSMQPGNVIFLTDKVMDKALFEDEVGKFLFIFAHELEHIYRYSIEKQNNVKTDELLGTELSKEGFLEIKEILGEDVAIKLNFFITKMVESYKNYSYQDSKEEFFANAASSLYYGYSLNDYIKTQTDEDRIKWLKKQRDGLFEIQEKINDTFFYSTEQKNRVNKSVVRKQLYFLLESYCRETENCTKNILKICKNLNFIDENFYNDAFNILKEKKLYNLKFRKDDEYIDRMIKNLMTKYDKNLINKTETNNIENEK